MAFQVQNDTGTQANANSYVTVDEFKTYIADRLIEIDGGDAEIQAAAIQATDYIDLHNFKGSRLTDDQTTQFPRDDLYDDKYNLVEGIPAGLKSACFEYMLQVLKSQDLMPVPTVDASGGVVVSKSSSVGPVSESITYQEGYVRTSRPFPKADALLRPFLKSSSGRVVR